MAYIQLTKGKRARVDDEDFHYLNQWKWHYINSGYAGRSHYLGGGRLNQKSEVILMHRFILDTPSIKETDHINGDGLDNRKGNLRVATRSQNSGNTVGYSKHTAYKGIQPHRQKEVVKWRARINIGRRTYHLGLFVTEEEAALAYNEAASKHFGQYARLNQIGG